MDEKVLAMVVTYSIIGIVALICFVVYQTKKNRQRKEFLNKMRDQDWKRIVVYDFLPAKHQLPEGEWLSRLWMLGIWINYNDKLMAFWGKKSKKEIYVPLDEIKKVEPFEILIGKYCKEANIRIVTTDNNIYHLTLYKGTGIGDDKLDTLSSSLYESISDCAQAIVDEIG